MRRPWIWILCFATLVVAVRLVAGDQLDPRQWLHDLRAMAQHPWGAPAFILLYAFGTLLLLPALALHTAAAAVWGWPEGAFLSYAALNVGANFQFGLGRWLGRDLIEPWLARRGWSKATAFLRAEGVLAMTLVRFVPLPFAVVNATMGASPVRWRDFVLGTAVGAVPVVFLGSYVANSVISGLEHGGPLVTWQMVAAGVAFVAAGTFARWLSKRSGSLPRT